MNHFTKNCLTGLSLFVLFSSLGCKKSETTAPNAGYNKVKVFDYPQDDPRYSGMRIVAAGNGRFFMTYGYWNEQKLGYGIPPSAPRNQWMITDQDGNVIKQDSLPSGFTMGDVLALNDNSFIIIVYRNSQNWPYLLETIQLYNFDKNGQKISDYPLSLPVDLMNNQAISNLHLFRSVNGNALLSFHFGNTGYEDYGFVGELNLNGTFIWYKQFNFLEITGCTTTPDGNYIFTGVNDSANTNPNGFTNACNRVFFFKTSSTGDSLSYHIYKTVQFEPVESGNIIPAGNGNYLFCFSHPNLNNTQFSRSYIYEVNSNGDSLNAITLSIKNRNNVETIISQNDGSVLALMNTSNIIPLYSGSSFYDSYYQDLGKIQFNTSLVNLDANLKITGVSIFQDETTDLYRAACKTAEGKIACFGLLQNYLKDFYKPVLIILP